MQILFFSGRVYQGWVSPTEAFHKVGADDWPVFVRLYCQHRFQLPGLSPSFEKSRKKEKKTKLAIRKILWCLLKIKRVSWASIAIFFPCVSVLLCSLPSNPLFITACQTLPTFSNIPCYLKHLINLMPKDKWSSKTEKQKFYSFSIKVYQVQCNYFFSLFNNHFINDILPLILKKTFLCNTGRNVFD